MKNREPWHESDNPSRVARGAGWRAGVVVLCVVAFFGLLGIGGWLFKVVTADIKGQGDVHRKSNSADNRIFAQEGFEKRYQDILAADRKLDALAADVKTDPADRDARTRLTGAKNYCETAVGEYNAKARSVTQEKFRSEDLPWEINSNNPLTDCKESNR